MHANWVYITIICLYDISQMMEQTSKNRQLLLFIYQEIVFHRYHTLRKNFQHHFVNFMYGLTTRPELTLIQLKVLSQAKIIKNR